MKTEIFLRKIIQENLHDGRKLEYDLVATLATNTGLTKTHISQVINNPENRANYTTLKLLSNYLGVHPRKLVDAGLGINNLTLKQAKTLFNNSKYEE